MGVCVGDLDPRQVERLRGELAWLLVEHCAVPPFFDYWTGRARCRPPSRDLLEEIRHFASSVNFSPLAQVDVSSPEVRRFLGRLFERYLEVNPRLSQPRYQGKISELRVRAPRLAGEMQRGLLAFIAGKTPDFGTRRQRPSWLESGERRLPSQEALAHRARLLEAVLARTAQEARVPVAAPAATGKARERWQTGTQAEVTVPVPASAWPSVAPGPPFAAPASQQHSVPGAGQRLAEAPTGPLPSPGGRFAPGAADRLARSTENGGGAAPGMGEDLYQMYGDYLRDMQVDSGLPSTYHRAAPAAPAGRPASTGAGARAPAPYDGAVSGPAVGGRQNETDQHLFWQLRYQVEAYVRRAARSYGVQARSADPFAMLEALRRSTFVDEADLRIAEGILALTDRVTAGGAATVEDYRQAMTLYLLYHRSHLGE
jgi:hypothetical protein